jgi:hypothetical protein
MLVVLQEEKSEYENGKAETEVWSESGTSMIQLNLVRSEVEQV